MPYQIALGVDSQFSIMFYLILDEFRITLICFPCLLQNIVKILYILDI